MHNFIRITQRRSFFYLVKYSRLKKHTNNFVKLVAVSQSLSVATYPLSGYRSVCVTKQRIRRRQAALIPRVAAPSAATLQPHAPSSSAPSLLVPMAPIALSPTGAEPLPPAAASNAGTASIESALAAIRAGKFVAVMDNEDRENEGDLIMAAESATEQNVAFMLRHSTGIVCVPALPERLEALRLPLMVEKNTETHQCKFTVTVDLREGNSTGVSAADRARTIRALADDQVGPEAFNRPGHIFPLVAVHGGVLERAGHTEAAVDLARLAGLKPVGFICEMMDQDGRMMRRPQLEQFSRKHDVPLITISDLIRYRARTEALVTRVGAPVLKKTPVGDFTAVEFASKAHARQSYHALVFGDVDGKRDVPVYIVEAGASGVDGDVRAMWAQQSVAKRGAGVVVYANDSAALLQISGELMARQSIFGMCMQVVRDLGAKSVRLLLPKVGEAEPALQFDPLGFGVDVTGVDHFVVPS